MLMIIKSHNRISKKKIDPNWVVPHSSSSGLTARGKAIDSFPKEHGMKVTMQYTEVVVEGSFVLLGKKLLGYSRIGLEATTH